MSDDEDTVYGPDNEAFYPLDTRTSELLRAIREERDHLWRRTDMRAYTNMLFWMSTDCAHVKGHGGRFNNWDLVGNRALKLLLISECLEIFENVCVAKCLQFSLQVLIIRRCDVFWLPALLGTFATLYILEIDTCNRLGKLPESVGQLTTLHALRISFCAMLTKLPDSIGQLTALCDLHINHCPLVTQLPESLHGLAALRVLSGVQCPAFGCLPNSISHLKVLKILSIEVSELKSFCLPESVGELDALEALNIRAFFADMIKLPESIGNLSRLKVLMISNRRLTRLPESLGRLFSLRMLNLECTALKELPDTVCQLEQLEDFSICSGSTVLHHVPPHTNHSPADIRLWFGRRYAPPKLLLLVLTARHFGELHLPDECWTQILEYEKSVIEK